jgi:hypothetical protein
VSGTDINRKQTMNTTTHTDLPTLWMAGGHDQNGSTGFCVAGTKDEAIAKLTEHRDGTLATIQDESDPDDPVATAEYERVARLDPQTATQPGTYMDTGTPGFTSTESAALRTIIDSELDSLRDYPDDDADAQHALATLESARSKVLLLSD